MPCRPVPLLAHFRHLSGGAQPLLAAPFEKCARYPALEQLESSWSVAQLCDGPRGGDKAPEVLRRVRGAESQRRRRGPPGRADGGAARGHRHGRGARRSHGGAAPERAQRVEDGADVEGGGRHVHAEPLLGPGKSRGPARQVSSGLLDKRDERLSRTAGTGT